MRISIFADMKIETTHAVWKNLPQIAQIIPEKRTNCRNFSHNQRYLQEKYATEL